MKPHTFADTIAEVAAVSEQSHREYMKRRRIAETEHRWRPALDAFMDVYSGLRDEERGFLVSELRERIDL